MKGNSSKAAKSEKKYIKATTATRDSFINAFFMLAHQENIYQISVHEITDIAGYNRATFYRYFADIYGLIEYAEDEFLRSIWKAIDEKCAENPIGERQFFETMIQCFRKNKYQVSVLLSEENRSHFLRRISENAKSNHCCLAINTPKKRTIQDIYFFGVLYAISINLQSQDALSDEDLLDVIQNMFDNWYRPEMESNENDSGFTG
ncbi:MAG: TetR/AcrR family transcriptional regulator [Lachnospiraceae bacterium]|nr:TetR/AcrR family transcriptional regulator [Lachnospiraceae bacterium]